MVEAVEATAEEAAVLIQGPENVSARSCVERASWCAMGANETLEAVKVLMPRTERRRGPWEKKSY